MQHTMQPVEDGWGASASVGAHRRPEPEVEEVLMAMPSFRSISGTGQEWPPLVLGYLHELDEGETKEEEEEFEFEFCSASMESHVRLEPVDAEEVFSDGCIRPVYPLFRRDLVFEECDGKPKISAEEIQNGDGDCDAAGAIGFCLSFRDFMTSDEGSTSAFSSSSSGSWESPDEMDTVPTESFCVWAPVRRSPPSPGLSKKSTSKKWRLLNLVSRLNRGDGKERVLFVAASASSAAERAKNKDNKRGKALPPAMATSAAGEEKKKGKTRKGGGAKVPMETEMAAAHRLYYAKEGAAAGDRRRSFLPYRKDLFGLFGNVNAGASTSTKLSPKTLFKFF